MMSSRPLVIVSPDAGDLSQRLRETNTACNRYHVISNGAEDDAASRVLGAGADVTGSVAGAIAGLLLAGPPGAVGGAVAGPLLASVLREITHRILSHREDARVGGAFRAAAAGLQERLDQGDEVRDDGFFASRPDRRSDAEEIIEGVLLAAQRGHEERKVEFLGYMLANLCFESEVDANLANWTIKTAQELTWAQLVLLSAIGRSDRPTLPAVEIGTNADGWGSWGIHAQLADLGYARREMIQAKADETPRLGLKMPNTRLGEQELSTAGTLLFQLMWLERIPQADVMDVLGVLQVPAASDP